MKHTYHIIKSVIRDRRFAWLKKLPSSVKKIWKLTEGVPLGDNLPPHSEFPIDHKWGDMLPDLVPNVLNILVISKDLREILQNEGVKDVEYLPIIILDKKGRIKSQEYCVANVIGSVDCLDIQNSVFQEDPLEEGQIIDIMCLNIHEERIPDDIKLFRLKQRRHLFIIRNDLLQQLNKRETSGLETFNMNDAVYIP